MLRLIPAATTFLFLWSSCLAPGQAPAEGPDTRQILWQRSLDDALAVCQATGRPLLIAVNMDGESASDRIVHEEYRDPAFVAATRRCVCLGASVFRHNARDHDDQGRRIPCPRFGEITCGEHMALEPVLFAKYLADGERVAPRHALVLPDGKKAFDLSLCFDLQDIDRALVAAVAPFQPLPATLRTDDWASLAARRDHRGRALLEAALAQAQDQVTMAAAIAAIAASGDQGSLEALRLLAIRALDLSDQQGLALSKLAGRLASDQAWFGVLQEMVERSGSAFADPGADARRPRWLAWMTGLKRDAGQRSYLLAHCSVGEIDGAASLLARFWDDTSRYSETMRSHDGPVRLRKLLQAANAVSRRERDLPRAGGPSDAMPEASVLQKQLEVLDAVPREGRDDPEWLARFAKASLDLGRRHTETGQRDTQLLLEDAAQHFAKALAKQPDRYEWWIERARAAYFLGRFADEVEFGGRALELAAGKGALAGDEGLLDSKLLADARAIEALRWIGDGHARLLGERAGKDAAAEVGGMIDGLRAVGIAAVSPYGYEADWLGFASLCGVLGLHADELAILHCGALRLPASRELRQALNAALWNSGRPELAPAIAELVAGEHSSSADACWFAGYAWILAAEDARRCERPRTAIAHYQAAEDWFIRAASLQADYRDNCRYMQALARCGQGMAWSQVWPDGNERRNAGSCLAQAVNLHGDLSQLRDGLGYDVFDLVDKTLEWRAGSHQQTKPLALLDGLDKVAPTDPFWAAAVSDSALREALRADGRNPERKERATVDAAGKPITMLMGVPDAEGDAWLRDSIEAGRRAAQRARTDTDKLPLAQAQTIWAERMLERKRSDGVQEALTEAAGLMKVDPPAAGADVAALTAVAAQLRALLGDARPRLREGR